MKPIFKQLKNKSRDDLLDDIMSQINDKEVTILSRIEHLNEVVAIIPSANRKEDVFFWCWISGTDGSYAYGDKRSRKELADTILTGGWNFQPGAQIILDVKRG